LPFDAVLALTTGYESDRNGNYYPYISPDVVVSKQDNFDDLLADMNIQEGIRFNKGEVIGTVSLLVSLGQALL